MQIEEMLNIFNFWTLFAHAANYIKNIKYYADDDAVPIFYNYQLP